MLSTVASTSDYLKSHICTVVHADLEIFHNVLPNEAFVFDLEGNSMG